MALLSTAKKVATGLLDMDTPSRMARAKMQGFDTDTTWYHGTNDLDNIAKTGFDPSFTGKGNDQFGSGFYFSTSPSQASSFATNLNTNKAGEVQPAGMVKSYLALKSPLVVDGTKVSNINDLPIDLSSDDVRELLEYSTALKRGLDDEQMNPMGDQFAEFWDDGPTDEMMEKLVENYTNSNLSAIEGDLFDGDATAFREGLAKVTGYDGIVIDFGDGFKNAVAWKPEQVRSTSAKFDSRKANRGDLVASNPVATAAGLGGVLAMTGSEDADAGVISSLVKMLAKGKADGTVVNYPDELIESTPFELRKAIADHNESVLGPEYRESFGDTTFYRGGGSERSALKNDVWMSSDPYQASTYAGQIGGNVMPLKVRKGDIPEVYSNSPEWNRIGLLDSSMKIPRNEYPEELGRVMFNSEQSPYAVTDTNKIAQFAKDEGFGGVSIKGLQDIGPYQRGADLSKVRRAESLMLADGSNARSVNAAFDPAKESSRNLLASNPAATMGAGILGALAASQSNDTYADYSPENLARLRTDDVGSYQAAQSPQLARAAGLMGQVNERGVDDPLMGMVSPRIPSELMNKIAYNDKRGVADYLKAAAGLLGLY